MQCPNSTRNLSVTLWYWRIGPDNTQYNQLCHSPGLPRNIVREEAVSGILGYSAAFRILVSYDFSILLLSLELSNMLIGTSSLHVVPQMTFRHTRVLENLPRYYTMQPPLLQYFSSPIHLKVPHNVSDTKN